MSYRVLFLTIWVNLQSPSPISPIKRSTWCHTEHYHHLLKDAPLHTANQPTCMSCVN